MKEGADKGEIKHRVRRQKESGLELRDKFQTSLSDPFADGLSSTLRRGGNLILCRHYVIYLINSEKIRYILSAGKFLNVNDC